MTFQDLLPGDADMELVILLAASLSVLFGVLAVWFGMIDREHTARRPKALKQRRDDLYAEMTAPRTRGLANQGIGFARRVTKRLKLLTGEQAAKVQSKLVNAGFRSRDAVTIYMFAKLVMPAATGAVMVVLIYVLNVFNLEGSMNLVLALAGILIGFYAPDLVLRNITQRRRQKLSRALPDALDLMVITTEAGLNLDSSLARVAREMRLSSPELADELELTSIELGFLPERRQALENFESRTGLPMVRALVSTLAQAEKYGTPLAHSLRTLASEMRDERLMKAEEKAARLPATMTVPMVIFILPALFIVLIGPGILKVLDNLQLLDF